VSQTMEKMVGAKVAVAPSEADLEKIMAFLRKTWGAPVAPGTSGCDPCRSGLDRFVIADPAFRGFAR